MRGGNACLPQAFTECLLYSRHSSRLPGFSTLGSRQKPLSSWSLHCSWFQEAPLPHPSRVAGRGGGNSRFRWLGPLPGWDCGRTGAARVACTEGPDCRGGVSTVREGEEQEGPAGESWGRAACLSAPPQASSAPDPEAACSAHTQPPWGGEQRQVEAPRSEGCAPEPRADLCLGAVPALPPLALPLRGKAGTGAEPAWLAGARGVFLATQGPWKKRPFDRPQRSTPGLCQRRDSGVAEPPADRGPSPPLVAQW